MLCFSGSYYLIVHVLKHLMVTHGLVRFYLCLNGELVVLFLVMWAMKKTCCLEVVSWLALLIAYFLTGNLMLTLLHCLGPWNYIHAYLNMKRQEVSYQIWRHFYTKKRDSHVLIMCHNRPKFSKQQLKSWNLNLDLKYSGMCHMGYCSDAFFGAWQPLVTIHLQWQNKITSYISYCARWKQENHTVLERTEGE